MLGPEPAWPLGQGHAQKKGKDLGFLLGSGHRKSPGSCSGGTSRFPQLLLLGECSPFLWECFLLLWECFLLLLGTAGGQASIFYPSQSHGTIPTRPRARHSTSPGTEAPRLKCYKNSVRVQGSIAHLSCSPSHPFPKHFGAACPALLVFPQGIPASSLAMQHPLKKGTRHLGCFSF